MSITNKPLISICIPTYNGSEFIFETLETAINQTYTNIEIIITDDCSTDNTLEICEEFAKKDVRIKIYKNKQNLGLVGNWCKSIEKSNSDWIKFLFQDDLLTPNCVQEMIATALEHNVNFVISNREYIFEKNVPKNIIKNYSEDLPKIERIFESNRVYTPKETAKCVAPHIFNNCIGEPPTFLFNKNQYSRADFPDVYLQIIDYVFILNKILVHEFVFINKNLLKFRIHNSSESMKNTTIDTSNKKSFYKYLYIQYYEKLLICHDLIHKPVFKNIKEHIPKKDILKVKKWLILKSYRKHNFKNVFPFYNNSKIKDFLLSSFFTRNYIYLNYKIHKLMYKKFLQKYHL